MTKALIVQLADDVVEAINKKQGGWTVKFQAERVYYPKTEFEESDTVHVHASVFSWEKVPDTRQTWKHIVGIEIGIQYRPPAAAGQEAKSKFDDLVKLSEEITDYWEDNRTAVSDATLMEMTVGSGGSGLPCVPEHIDKLNQFTGVIRLTFWKYR